MLQVGHLPVLVKPPEESGNGVEHVPGDMPSFQSGDYVMLSLAVELSQGKAGLD
jgi:hypothetical protein